MSKKITPQKTFQTPARWINRPAADLSPISAPPVGALRAAALLFAALFFATPAAADELAKAELGAIAAAAKKGDFASAYELSAAACARRCDYAAINFALATSALAVKKFDAALAAIERALIYEPESIAAHFAAAKIYKLRGEKELLNAEIEKILKLPELSAAQRAVALKMAEDTSLRAFGSVSFGAGFESNPQHQSERDFYYHTPIGDLRIPAAQLEHAGYFTASASAGFRKVFSARDALQFTASSYNKRYAKPRALGFSNISVLGISALYSHAFTDRLSFFASAGYDYTLLRAQPYSHGYFGELSASYGPLSAGFRAQFSSYVQPADKAERSSNYAAYVQGFYSHERGYLFARATVSTERAPHSENLSADYDGILLSAGGKFAFSPAWAGKFSASIGRNSYKRFHSGFGSARRDTTGRTEASLVYSLTPRQELEFGAGYARTHSNQPLYSFSSTSFFANYSYSFN